MPAPRRKIAGDPIIPENWIEAPPPIPSDWIEAGAAGPSPSRTARAQTAFQDPLGRRFEGGTETEEESNERLNTQAIADTEAQAKLRHDYASEVFGPSFDRTRPFDPGPVEWLRLFDIARSRDEYNRQDKFQKTFGPNAELTTLEHPDKSRAMYARRSKDEPWREVPNSPEVASALVSGPTVLGVAGGATSLKTGMWTGLGVLADDLIESARGYPSSESNLDLGFRAAKEGALAAGIDLTFRGIGPLTRTSSSPHPAVLAAERQGFQPLSIGQMSPSAVVKAMFKQSARLGITGKVPKMVESQQKSMLESAERYMKAGGEFTDEMVTDLVEAQRKELDALLKPERISRQGAAQEIQDGVLLYDKMTSSRVSAQFKYALSLNDDFALNLKPVQEKIANRRESFHLELEEVSKETGQPLTESTLPKAVGEIESIMSLLERAKPIMQTVRNDAGEWTAFENLKQIRTRLGAVMDDPTAGISRKYAGELYHDITKVMKNPIGGTPEFRKAWEVANAAHHVYRTNMELLQVAKIVKSAEASGPEALESVVTPYFGPGYGTQLKVAKDILPDAAWERVKEAFQLDLAAAPTLTEAQSRFNYFRTRDKDAFRLLVSPAEESSIAHYLSVREKFETGVLRKLSSETRSAGGKIDFILSHGDPQNMADLVRLSGGQDSPTAWAMKTAVYDRLLKGATEILEHAGETGMNPKALLRNMEAVEESGVLKPLFTKADWTVFNDFKQYATRLVETADAGTSIQTAVQAAKLTKAPAETLFGFGKKVLTGTIRPLLEFTAMASILATPVAYRAAGGPGSAALRVANAMSITAVEYEFRQPPEEHKKPQ